VAKILFLRENLPKQKFYVLLQADLLAGQLVVLVALDYPPVDFEKLGLIAAFRVTM